jgi:hypothetical protein
MPDPLPIRRVQLRTSPGRGVGVNSGCMGILARDTDCSAEGALIGVMRQLPAWRKLELLDDASRTTRELLLAGLRRRHPGLSGQELHRLLMDRLLGERAAERIWGSRPVSGR